MALAGGLAAALAACATPGSLTGGPADTTPPALVQTAPAGGATNVTDRRLVLTFSERIDPASARAVTVVPETEAPPEVRVGGREVEVVFPTLRDSTTYVVTVGTDLRDQRGVALAAPLTVAFATGDAIDRGRLDGAVRDPQTGEGAAGLDVWAYALADTLARPDPTAEAPDYRTQTGADGRFRLDYLRPGRYFVAAVADRNRNGRADPGEAFAAPPRPALATADAADSLARPTPADFWTTTLDTVPPVAQRVRPASDRRFSVRFSEPVRLAGTGAEAWTVTDSTSGRAAEVALYQPSDAPFEVFFETAAPLAPTPHRVAFRPEAGAAALTDSAGNATGPFALSFTPPDRPDTLRARFSRFLPPATAAADSAQTLLPGERPGVRFTAPLTPAEAAARVSLLVAGERQPATLTTTDGLRYTLDASPPAAFALAVAAGDSAVTRRYAVLDESETGGIVGRVEGAAGPVLVEVRPVVGGETQTLAAEADGSFASGPLRPADYRLRVVVDLDGDGRWSGGALAPYRPPEPVRILPEPVNVRARWETEVPPVRFDAADAL